MAAVVALVAVSLTVSEDGGSTLYVEDLRDQAVAMSQKASTFQDTLERIGTLDRVELNGVIDGIEATVLEVEAFLADEEIPDEMVGPVTVFGLALDSWHAGVTGLRDRLLIAADDATATGIEEGMVLALLDIKAGDRLYGRFLEAMAAADVPQPVSPLPQISFLPQSYPVSAGARTMVASARAEASGLKLRSALGIEQVTTVPEWVVDTENALVVEATEVLSVKVVVSNKGNAPADPSTVLLTLEGIDASTQELTQPVDALAAGSETTVTFEGLSVEPGTAYQVVVQLPLAEGEAETEDNTRVIRFRINEPTPETTTTTSG